MKTNKNTKRLLSIFSPLCAVVGLSMLSFTALLKAQDDTPTDPNAIVDPNTATDPTITTDDTPPPIPTVVDGISFANVGDAANAPDTTGFGAVSYPYQIGITDVTAAQYCSFLNAVAHDDPNGLYDARMGEDATGVPALISRSGKAKNYSYSVIGGRDNYPIVYVSYFSAQRFCNWMQSGNTETGTYMMSGNTIVPASPASQWRLPTEDEWYKAAYYKGGSATAGYWKYPTQSDTAPQNKFGSSNGANFGTWNLNPALLPVQSYINSSSFYGCSDMGGEVDQWIEHPANSSANTVVVRGGNWQYGSGINGEYPANRLLSSSYQTYYPYYSSSTIGFRIVNVDPTNSGTAVSDFSDSSASSSSIPGFLRDHLNFENLTPDEQYALTGVAAIAAIAGSSYGVKALIPATVVGEGETATTSRWATVKGWGTNVKDGISSGVSNLWQGTKNCFSNVGDSIKSKLGFGGEAAGSASIVSEDGEIVNPADSSATPAVNTVDKKIINPNYKWYNPASWYMKNPNYVAPTENNEV